eukprot:TRINITY_DN18055_c0_g1_i1.p1 TRINITY_DN18055_c0_g1~~TRINITY_DN18055_c0_g1_i1.p1  ORF type:complete len:326 (+),score=58.04 TRINITY_DN18055_c0_g1_i1:66-1043(+)
MPPKKRGRSGAGRGPKRRRAESPKVLPQCSACSGEGCGTCAGSGFDLRSLQGPPPPPPSPPLGRLHECCCCLVECDRADLYLMEKCSTLHWVCSECLRGYLENKVATRDVENLRCPHGCPGSFVGAADIKAVLNDDTYQQYLSAQLLTWAKSGGNWTLQCPECGWLAEWDRDPQRHLADVTCIRSTCLKQFCSSCGGNAHKRLGFETCEGYRRFLRESGHRQHEGFEGLECQQCPKCKHAVSLGRGCKFIYCSCRSVFCLICGRQLTEEQHYSHFRDSPYGKLCYGGARDRGKHVAQPECRSCAGYELWRPDQSCKKCRDWNCVR